MGTIRIIRLVNKSINAMLVATAFICVMSGNVHATLISLDDSLFGAGSFTRDTATGLEWLDLSLTSNLSMNTILANSGVGGTYYGLRYATGNEVMTLFNDAGIVPAVGYSHTKAGWDAISILKDLMFVTPMQSAMVFGITGTANQSGSNPSDHYVSAYIWLHNSEGTVYNAYTNIDMNSFSDELYWIKSTSSSPYLGSFLVREQQPVPTPEPATFLLFVSGLGGLIIWRRKRRE